MDNTALLLISSVAILVGLVAVGWFARRRTTAAPEPEPEPEPAAMEDAFSSSSRRKSASSTMLMSAADLLDDDPE